jgi:hypothetical protein
MLYNLGRFLQLVGLLILPAAIAGTETGNFGTKTELILLGVGVAVFFLGWRLQQGGKA